MDLPDDWQPVDFDPWTIRPTQPTRGEIRFLIWLPLRDRSYTNFDDWIEEKLARYRHVYEVGDVTRRKVSGFDAISFSARPLSSLQRQVFIRQTWIGVPDTAARIGGGDIYRFMLSTALSEPKGEADVIYEKILASMRLSPRALDEALSKSEPCPR